MRVELPHHVWAAPYFHHADIWPTWPSHVVIPHVGICTRHPIYPSVPRNAPSVCLSGLWLDFTGVLLKQNTKPETVQTSKFEFEARWFGKFLSDVTIAHSHNMQSQTVATYVTVLLFQSRSVFSREEVAWNHRRRVGSYEQVSRILSDRNLHIRV